MRVIICGAGQVGWQLARYLSKEGNDVTVVDNQAALVARATDTLDVGGLTGFASHPDVLAAAGAEDAEMIIAATHSDEVNMVTCQIAHSVFRVPRKIARLRAQTYLDVIYSDLYQRDHLPSDVVISPEKEVADAALRQLSAPSSFEVETFLDGQMTMLGLLIEEDCPVINTPLRQLTDLFSTLSSFVAGVRRDRHLFVPKPEDQIYAGDQIYVFTRTEDINRTLEVFGKSAKKQERVLIIGGGSIGLRVASELESRTDRVRCRVIERDREQAEIAADLLEKTVVLHGDGLDIEILQEANIAQTDSVLCLTDDDKTNLLASARAKSSGAKMALALINDTSLSSMMETMDVDAFLNPRATTVSSILRHIRHGRVRAVYAVGDAEAEVMELQTLSNSQIAGRPLEDLDFPDSARIVAVKKGNDVLRPTAEMRLEEGDLAVVFAMADAVRTVEAMFQVSVDFF
ncbi:MAG: Trk system potassium transporter TrkA [Pseudomonadota bacterium]